MFYVNKNDRFRQEVMTALMNHFDEGVAFHFNHENECLNVIFDHLSSPAKFTTMTEEDMAAGFYGGGVQEGLAGETFTIRFGEPV
jgi:hypothetical protein